MAVSPELQAAFDTTAWPALEALKCEDEQLAVMLEARVPLAFHTVAVVGHGLELQTLADKLLSMQVGAAAPPSPPTLFSPPLCSTQTRL
eukprot:2608336-Prymnesium_polylepis.1